jgi:hypothetical protein
MGPKEELVLRPSIKPMLWLFLVSGLFVALGVGMLEKQPLVAWAAIGLFGLGMLVALIMLIPGSCSLRLSSSGFTVRKFFFPTHYNWNDVTPFGVFSVSGNKMVAFNFTGVYKVGRWGNLSQTTTGYSACLPCNFGGMTAEQLADLMNDWRNRYATETEDQPKLDAHRPVIDPNLRRGISARRPRPGE